MLADDAPTLTATQPAWPVNSLALAVLPDLLAQTDLARWRRAIQLRRDQLVDLLAAHGATVIAGDAPWVLTQFRGLRDRLAPHGVVVRDCSSFGLDGWARIAVPDERGYELLAQGLDRIADAGRAEPTSTEQADC